MAKRKKPEPLLDWKRAQRDETDTASRRTWDSRCGKFRVQESISKFGMGTTFYAMAKNEFGFYILSRHKKRGPAEDACEKTNRLTLPKA